MPALQRLFLVSPLFFSPFAAGYVHVKHPTTWQQKFTYFGGAACAFFFIFIVWFIRDPLSLSFPQRYQTGYLCLNRLLGWIVLPRACTPWLGLPPIRS